MGKRSKDEDAISCKKYGVPLYGAAWIPRGAIRSFLELSQDEDRREKNDGDEASRDVTPPQPISAENYLVLAGGGGEGRSGIPNAILLTYFDSPSNSLSDQPVAKHGTGGELPYRMDVHPVGEGLICSLPKSCRWFEWVFEKNEDFHRVNIKPSERVLSQLEDVGQQLALRFNDEGSILAAGGEDGKLRAFKWPSMEIILDEAKAHTAVKDLAFSPDGKYLVSVGGPGRVWDVTSSTSVASLQKENDEIFGFCRFSHSSDNNQVLYITAMRGQGGNIVKWNTSSWERISTKCVVRDPVSAFNVSADGQLLAIGTIQGDVLIINSTSMYVQSIVRKAHLGLVTALAFSKDSKALASTSLDSSARVTLIKDENKNGLNLWIVLFVMLIALALSYYAKMEGIF